MKRYTPLTKKDYAEMTKVSKLFSQKGLRGELNKAMTEYYQRMSIRSTE